MRKSNLLVIFLLLSAVLLYPESKKFIFSSDETSIVMAQGKEKTILSGNAHITSDSMDIKADRIVLYGKDLQYAECSGNITVIDENQGIKLTTSSLFYDREKKRLVIKDYAEMIDQKNEVVVKGGYFENLSDDDITIIQIGVRIFKTSDDGVLTARSEFARYDRKNKILDLSGMPVVYKNNDEFKASRITVNIDTDELKLYGDVSGSVSTDKKSEKAKQ